VVMRDQTDRMQESNGGIPETCLKQYRGIIDVVTEGTTPGALRHQRKLRAEIPSEPECAGSRGMAIAGISQPDIG
jgi:hypothetical protein